VPQKRQEKEGEGGRGGERGKEEEAVKITTSPLAAGCFRGGFFRRENREFLQWGRVNVMSLTSTIEC